MIHHNDEKVFRFIEISVYLGLIVGFPVVKIVTKGNFVQLMAALFTLLGALGIVYFTRYFIYQDPHLLWRRERAVFIELTRNTKIALCFGYLMAIPMFLLGTLGLFNPGHFERTIKTISPMRFLLS